MRVYTIILYLFILCGTSVFSQEQEVRVGAAQTDRYFPLLAGKRVALVANQTSLIQGTHLADSMLAADIQLSLVMSPEHGFRGTADAGQKVQDGRDEQSGLPIVSLYGKHKKPTADDLNGIDLVVFDIQDVGVRFYTYISTLHYVMEACAENNIPVLVLDRPNPNGFYVDGPVLDTATRSFVGMHPVPLVHGMTIGEYALMINGQAWLAQGVKCDLMVLPCENYDHSTHYVLPVKPSPNLPNIRSVLLYPALGLFEGTLMSVGRGTAFPFQVYGHPNLRKAPFKFTPASREGARYPKYQDQLCRGYDLRVLPMATFYVKGELNLSYLIQSYQAFNGNPDFFNNFFYRLAGTRSLQSQIEQGLSVDEIRASWQADLDAFKVVRKTYLLYPDFE